MTNKLPPLNWLRAFEVSARHTSFTHGARELNMTQAAISKQVKLLEFHLGQALFLRRARSLELTKQGRVYLTKVQDAFGLLSLGTEEVFGAASQNNLTLRVSIAFANQWLIPRLADFYARHPEVSLRIVSSIWNEEADAEPVDLDIRYNSGVLAGFTCDRLTRDRLMVLASPEMARGIGSAEELSQVQRIEVLGYQESWAHWCAFAGVPDLVPASVMQFDNSLNAFEAARQGAGVVLARSSLAQPELNAGRLVQLFDAAPAVDEGFFLLSREHSTTSQARHLFRDWILSEITKV